MSSKVKNVFVCVECGYNTSKWLGRCPDCQNWNSFVEEARIVKKGSSRSDEKVVEKKLRKLNELSELKERRVTTNIGELDRVLGGGLVPGSLTLIGGEPGIGKSTLLLMLCHKVAQTLPNKKIIYVSGEEAEAQIASRAKRLGISEPNIEVVNETNWENVKQLIKNEESALLIIDSIQTIYNPTLDSAPGTVTQIREVTFELMNFIKNRETACFIVGHITKEGNIAGPKILEHMVDTVVYFEGDQGGMYRILRSMKNRFGATSEIGLFEMVNNGLEEVKNPSKYFIDDEIDNRVGRSLTCILEGSRPLFLELQALVVENKYGNGRRATQGVDTNRVSMLIAVIEKHLGMPIGFNDIYVNLVGGMKINSRDLDLSVIAALISSYKNVNVSQEMVFVGEVGLAGEVRNVPKLLERYNEMTHFNYKYLVTSQKAISQIKKKSGVQIIGINNIDEIPKILEM
ncbi:MAG: DNA repair protein RadA [Bdellovibrio sp. CG12_big_fil_rev_8_21_14_0_65_39_13]|nr:MAG: DNA repair protein RadA [Bdellovibrio sp. CG22_combo_CG10-13_8_21_14_all_39_27]PIQ60728.1 MAG: DNA repair protein RadA [Bdellovibrio sp. CG12_big_fil_rev_8_21_14_0_65_39_13]PIR36352.1 MAG: DNA repair protein RadA [Bdellovibrio sp. CG11_big_fil_rev_8_21_14_0_20_39_38]